MSLGSSGDVRFTRVRPWVHPGVFGFTPVRSEGRWAHPRSLGSLGFALVFVGFIRVHWVTSCLSWEYLSLSGVVGFTRDCTVGRSVHRGRWVHSRSPLVSLGSSRVVSFTRIRLVGDWVHPGPLG